MIGDKHAKYLLVDPFRNDGTVKAGFCDKASRANKNGMDSRVPVQLSKPMSEACAVGYTVWDYDAGTVLQTGELHFDRLVTNRAISIDTNDRNVLIEISSVQNVVRGENSFHYIAVANGQSG